MATTIPVDHPACSAYKHCQALGYYGLPVFKTDQCYFAKCGDLWELSIDARLDADQLTQNKELVASLFDSVLAQLTDFDQQIQENQAVEALKKDFDAVFAARFHLWKTMIDSAKAGRSFVDTELDYYQENIDKAQLQLEKSITKADQTLAIRALTAHDAELKRRFDIQFDADMIADINQLVGNVINMRPTLIVGDKGIAKTQIAKFVAELYGFDPIVISVKGDMMSDELIGKLKHDRVKNTFVFQEGMLLTAMRQGLPILLDEINFGDQAIIARLQDILLRRPGDTVYIQESGEEPITVQPGFVVFATANEASQRYRHREILDPAIRDRFDIIMRAYPDSDDLDASGDAINPGSIAAATDPLTRVPTSLLRLALSSAVDGRGIPSKHIQMEMLESFVRLAHITEYLYSVAAKDVVLDLTDDHLTSVVLEESMPLMTDCITPRTVSKLVATCAAGNLPSYQLDNHLIQRTIRSLDQAGSTHNLELAQQASFMLDITTGVTMPKFAEGGKPITQFIDLDDTDLDVEAILAATADAEQSENAEQPENTEQSGLADPDSLPPKDGAHTHATPGQAIGFAALSTKAKSALLAAQFSLNKAL